MTTTDRLRKHSINYITSPTPLVTGLKKYHNSVRHDWTPDTIDHINDVFYDPSEQFIAMPNEIFEDLQTRFTGELKSYIPFAYAYYYFITYLYKYSKYGHLTNMNKPFLLSYLGYSPKSLSPIMNDIIKQNGVLDSMKYTTSTTDYPIYTRFDENGIIHLDTMKEFKKNMRGHAYDYNTANLRARVPLLAIKAHRPYREKGTFYSQKNTHYVDVDKFIKIISSPVFGINSSRAKTFYIYGVMCSIMKLNNQVQCSQKLISDLTQIPVRTLQVYLQHLEKENLIEIDRKINKKTLRKNLNIYRVV